MINQAERLLLKRFFLCTSPSRTMYFGSSTRFLSSPGRTSRQSYSSPSNGPTNNQENDEEQAIQDMVQVVDKVVKENPVVIFMKGTPGAPKCGYSKAASNILSKFKVHVSAVDVLENNHVRQAIKKYSSWPTIPQIFVKGELIGGTDILLQMCQNGELEKLFIKENLLPETVSNES